MVKAGSLQRFYRKPLGTKTEYVARFAKPSLAADHLRDFNFKRTLELLNDPTFPADRATDILHSFVRDEVGYLHIPAFAELRLEVVTNYWKKYGAETLKQLKSPETQKQLDALVILHEIGYHLDAAARNDALTALKESRIKPQNLTEMPAENLAWRVKIRLLTVNALEHLDQLMVHLPAIFPLQHQIDYYLYQHLEYFQAGTDRYLSDISIPRDYHRKGTAVETMRKLLRTPEITEDQIQRLQGTKYCSKPYGEATPYRTKPAKRSSDKAEWEMMDPKLVPEEMNKLVTWVNSGRAQDLHPFIRAIMFYARLDRIHPFTDRNKHAARFFAARILAQGKEDIVFPPIIDDFDFRTPIPFVVPDVINTAEVQSIVVSQTLIDHQKTTELVFQMLCLYVQRLKYVFPRYASTQSSPSMREIVNILGLEAGRFWRGEMIH